MNDGAAFELTGESVRQDAPKALELRDYQTQSTDALAEGIRQGHRRQILCIPTGGGKSVVAAHLIKKALEKFSRTYFIVDRIALLDQAAALFDSYGLTLGVIQAGHWRWRPWEKLQVCSAQTLARRGPTEDVKLIIVDECHIQSKAITDFLLAHPDIITVGLSATPMTKGLGRIYSNVVNVTTTDRLIDEGWLTKMKAYAAVTIDMKGAKLKSTGEWEEREIEARGMEIVGDVAAEWTAKTLLHFGGPVKTIIFTPTVAYGEELCRRFQELGHNFQQVSYLDRNDDERRNKIAEFRRPDSEIVGLVSCEALSRGFDVVDIKCGVFCKPYRKSLSAWIQQLGRVMRPAPGKEFALVLDHSGNLLRFNKDTSEFFSNGISKLDDGQHDSKVRPEPSEEDKAAARCGGCGFMMGGSRCPSCGWERPKKTNTIAEVGGEMVEVTINGKTKHLAPWLTDKDAVARQLWHIALERKGGDAEAANKFALAQYQNIYGQWPRLAFRNISAEPPDPRLASKVTSMVIAWAKRKRRATA